MDERVVRTLERAAWFGAIFVAAVGVIALIGWALDVDAMRAIHPAVGAIKVNAAISFVFVGLALVLVLRTQRQHVRASRALSSVVSVVGALTLLEYVPGADFGIDDVLFSDEATLFSPGRMSPISAAAFVAIGLALICLDTRGRAGHVAAQVLALGAGFVSLLALLGNVYGVRALYTIGGYEEVALNPAVALTVCSSSILCARPTRGVMAVVASEGPGGALARRLLPAAILVPAAIGALVILGEQTGLFDVEHETALFAATSILCFTALTWWTASAIVRIDVARRSAERAAVDTKRKADEQLVRSQRLESVGRLAGGIAHDFNNLLTVIITYGHLLQRRTEPDAKVAEIVRAAQRAGELTRQLLALSRRQVLQPTVVDLEELLDAMTDMLRRAIGEDIELEITKRAPIAPIYVDAGQIEQVILNLVVNARDAIPGSGRIAITLQTVGEHVRLTVRDSGVGMDPATLAQIFEPYFTTKGEAKGTGLGLPTALGIVEQSGGSIRVTSEPGDGTTFEVELPAHAGAEVATPAPPPPARGLTGTETVLLVEDDEQVRVIVATALREHGYVVLEAATSGDALLIAEQHPKIDLLLSDVVMPRMGGRQLAERIQQLAPAARVLFMSGHADDAILRHGIQTSAVAFIEKPIEPDTLLAKLREILDG